MIAKTDCETDGSSAAQVLRERKQTCASAGAGAQESKIRICKQGPPCSSQIQMSISHRKSVQSEKILLNPPSLSKPRIQKMHLCTIQVSI